MEGIFDNIKQKFIKFIIYFCFLVAITSCGVKSDNNLIKENLSNDNSIIKIAIVLPLSGENALLGQEYLALIKMGLRDNVRTKIKVTTYNYSNEKELKEIVEEIFKQKIKIIIGPISSKDTSLISTEIKHKDIIVFSLSNDPTLAEHNVFILGHAPMKQTIQLITYLINNGYKNYITLLPNNKYARTVSAIIENVVVSKDATMSKTEFYNNSDDDIKEALNIVSNIVDNLNKNYRILRKIVIIVADVPEILEKIYKYAVDINLNKKVIIAGDSRIDINANKDFEIIYNGSNLLEKSSLKERAVDLGIKRFSFLHFVAYDAGKIVATNLTKNYTKDGFINNLKNSSVFLGTSGKISFIDSIAQRQYDIIRKKGNL